MLQLQATNSHENLFAASAANRIIFGSDQPPDA
jgi:hypothetical protein